MARAHRTIDVSAVPELLRIVNEVSESGESLILTSANQELAVLTPVKRARPLRQRKTGIIMPDDALWKLVGAATEAPPTDASRKHEYLAEAYTPRDQ
ncbi:MAG: hypothetical protein QOF51_207 [Chloroflexota bacterium]|nr:hypothetical protein [Chloroflexota bacterium]